MSTVPARKTTTQTGGLDDAGRAPFLKLHRCRLDYDAALTEHLRGGCAARVAIAAGSRATSRRNQRRVGLKIDKRLENRYDVLATFDQLGYTLADFCRGVIANHKAAKRTGKPRVIALIDEALDVLHDAPQAAEQVFLSRFNKPYTVQGLRAIAKRHLDTATYELRHTFAQACLDDGVAPEVVSRLLGHRSSPMVWTYAEIREERVAEAASRLRLRTASC